MLRKIKLSTFETSFVFEIDTDKFTKQYAEDINGFFGGDKDRLSNFDDDVYAAALSLYSSHLFYILVNEQPAIKNFSFWFNREAHEGYLPLHDEDDEKTHCGIKVIDFDYSFEIPSSEDFKLETI